MSVMAGSTVNESRFTTKTQRKLDVQYSLLTTKQQQQQRTGTPSIYVGYYKKI